MEDDLTILREVFDESTEILDRLGADLDTLATVVPWQPVVDDVYRGVHTIKGNCAAVGWTRVADPAHAIETSVGRMRQATTRPRASEILQLRSCFDDLEQLLKEVAGFGGAAPPSPPEALAAPTPPSPKATVRAPASGAGAETSARYAALTPTVDLIIPGLRAPKVATIANTIAPTSGPLVSAPTGAMASMAPRCAVRSEGQSSLRVPLQAVNGALNHIWEVFLLRSQIAYLFEEHRDALKGAHALIQAWEPLDAALRRHVTELETVVMSMRLMSLRGLFSRMHQVVRAYAAGHPEKDVELTTHGEDIQVDKRVLDRLGEPFIHLVRNAIDHGIEPAAARVAAGKPRAGRLSIHAEATADRIVIRITDDGRGISAPHLLAKARERGIDVSAMHSDESALELIFRPGFSTVEQVTGDSGRGVGMDAVRTSITELGGSVNLETRPGFGTTFTVTLPVSVSIVPVVLLDVNGETYATHVSSVIEVCRVPGSEIRTSTGEPMLHFHDRFIRCLDLRTRMHGSGAVDASGDASLCVVRRAGSLLGLRVSRVIATTEVVVKPLPPLSPLRSYVLGVSILPTGQAIFVLSLEQLAEHLSTAPGAPGGGASRVAA